MRAPGEFRCAFFAADYEASRAFYRDGLGLAEIESWDRGPDDRGTIFAAASGRIEVLARPAGGAEDSPWDLRSPRGVTVVLEVPDVEAAWHRASERRLEVADALRDRPWGHRAFLLRDPDGLGLYLFSEIETG